MNVRVILLGMNLMLCLVVALVTISLLFQPVILHERTDWFGQTNEMVYAPDAWTYEGLGLRAEVWKEHPKFFRGLCVIGVASAIGAIFSLALLYNLKDNKDAVV